MQEYSLAMGVYLSIIRSGSVLNNYLIPILAKTNLGYAFLGGFCIYMMSLISGLVFIIFEKHAAEIDNRRSSAYLLQTYRVGLVKKFGIQFWLISLNIVFAYIGFESFYDVLKKYLESRFNNKSKGIDTIASLNYIVPILFSHLFGYVSDKFGRKITMMTMATFVLSISHLILFIIQVSKG